MECISNLIDSNTKVVKTMTALSSTKSVFSGYIAFVVNGKLIQRKVYDMSYCKEHDSCMYIIYHDIKYAINVSCKPLRGAFSVDALKCIKY